jgi:predicted DNA-binding transcriptional regulator AlpA
MKLRLDESIRNFDALPDSAHVPVTTAGAVLGVSGATIWRMTKAGRLTARRIGERNTRFSVREIRALIASTGQSKGRVAG